MRAGCECNEERREWRLVPLSLTLLTARAPGAAIDYVIVGKSVIEGVLRRVRLENVMGDGTSGFSLRGRSRFHLHARLASLSITFLGDKP